MSDINGDLNVSSLKSFYNKINEIKDNIAESERKLGGLLIERAQYDDISLQGLPVESKAFGPGVITAQEGSYFTAEFGGEEKMFAVPQSFISGALTTDDEIMQYIMKMIELDGETKLIRGQIKELGLKLKKYIAE